MTARSTGHRGADVVIDQLAKVDLHVHLPGTVRAGTLAELAEEHEVALPLPGPELYQRINSDPTPAEEPHGPWFPLLRVYELICASIRTRENFARVVYEALEDGLRASNVRYQELSFSPSVHAQLDVPYTDMVAGIAEGIAAARRDHGVEARAVAAVNREDTPEVALAMTREVVAHPHETVVGLGIDFDERQGLPERFVDAFMLAGKHGMWRTAHAGEHVPSAETVRTCLDLLGCDRIDHGYYVLTDDEIVRRCRDEGVLFNVAFTTSRRVLRRWRRDSVAEMVRRGLRVTINSDDPALFPTTLNDEYRIAAELLGDDRIPELVCHGVEAAFLAEEGKQELLATLAAANPPG